MTSAGRNAEFEKIVAAAQKKLEQKLPFLTDKEDLLQYIGTLSLKMKTETGKIIFQDKQHEMVYCPCVTKIVSFSNPGIVFPKDKKRNPFECAKIQYMLCKKTGRTDNSQDIIKKTTTFRGNCEDCYRMMLDGIFETGHLCL